MSSDGRMDEDGMVHIYNGLLLNHKKEWNNAICNNTEGPRDSHTKWGKSDKYYITFMWNLKNNTN